MGRSRATTAPAVGHARAAIEGTIPSARDIAFRRQARSEKGPVLVFTAVLQDRGRQVPIVVNVRRARGDTLEVSWAPFAAARRNEAVTSMPTAAQLGGYARSNGRKLWLVASSAHKKAMNWIVEAKSSHSARWKVGEKVRKKAFYAAEIDQDQAARLLASGKARLLSDAGQTQTPTRDNPRSSGAVEVYDPRTEAVRAQRQAIYETQVRRLLGVPWNTPFRDRTGRRLDERLLADQRSQLTKSMFAIGTAVQGKRDNLFTGTQRPTPKAVADAAARYLDYGELLQNRQDYEETLGMNRRSGFYRVTAEPTSAGLRHFVWPLRPGQSAPVPYASEKVARTRAEHSNSTEDPRMTRLWWRPSARTVTRKELALWLPPVSVFDPDFDL